MTFAVGDKVRQIGASPWDAEAEVISVDEDTVSIRYTVQGKVKQKVCHSWRLRKVGK
jgi:hypothetical protein